MGEEEKKVEEKKPEEAKKPVVEEKKEEKKEEPKAEKPSDEKKEETKAEESKDLPPPPPPQEIILRVYMHCEGCARKVRRCLKGFEGVEDVQTDCKTHKVVVKGEKADPLKVLDRVQKKSHRQVELLSPIPKPQAEEPKKDEEKVVKPEEKKEEPQVITVVLKVHMHCEACSQEIKKRIKRMKGVENAEPDLKSSQVTVKGVFEPPQLVQYVYKKTGKHAVIVKQEQEKKKEEGDKGKEEKKAEDGEKDGKKAEEESKKEEGAAAATGGGGGGGDVAATGGEEVAKAAEADQEELKMELKKNEFSYYGIAQNYQHYPQRIAQETFGYPYAYPPQIFSDENPNACSVM